MHGEALFEDTPILLEVCAGSVASGLAAQRGGASRIELCGNLAEGGITPSPGTILTARKQLKIQVYPIIRPRGGDFLYDGLELEIMRQDIMFCKKSGCDGIVVGILTADGKVDKSRTIQLVELAWPMGVTFHRAFDMTAEPFEALEDIIETGCERILTSGQRPTAPEGAHLIAQLVERAAGRILIMPGSGVRENNMRELVRITGAREFHTSAKTKVPARMVFKNLNMGSGRSEHEISVTDLEQVRKMLEIAREAIQDMH